jgi:NADH dehydrogenase FAD-containing subunit
MSFPVALTMGAHAADNLVRKLKNQKEEPLSFAYYGQGIQLGDDDAIGWMGFPDDHPHGMVARGQFALGIRKTFVNYLDIVFDIEKSFPGAFMWLGKNRYHKQKKQIQQNNLKGQSANN